MGNQPKSWAETMPLCSINRLELSTFDHLLPTYVLRWAVNTVNKINGFAHLSTFAHLFTIEHLTGRNSTLQGSYREQVGKVGRWAVELITGPPGGVKTLEGFLITRWALP